MKKKQRNPYKFFTLFKKGVRDSLALSFARSASAFCSTKCRLRECCYASRMERIFVGLNIKLDRHYEAGVADTIENAISELPSKPIPWFRFCVDGSLPARSDVSAREWRSIGHAMRRLVGILRERDVPIHLPVESLGKARSYRAMLPKIVVRRSSQAGTVS